MHSSQSTSQRTGDTDSVLFPPGGRDAAEEFCSQEIDGQALLLLTEEHLVSTLNLRLGPAAETLIMSLLEKSPSFSSYQFVAQND